MRKWLFAVPLVLGAIAAHPGEAEGGADRTEDAAREHDDERAKERAPSPKRESPRSSRISLEDATAVVRQAYGGRVLSATATEARPSASRPKEPGYRVRVDVDGRVKTVFVDGRGRIHERAQF